MSAAEGDVERNSSGGRRIQGGSSAHVEHVGIFDFGKSKSVGAWQVGQDGCGLHPAIVFERKMRPKMLPLGGAPRARARAATI